MSVKLIQFLEFECFRYELKKQILWRGHEEVALPPLAMKVFDYLICNRDRVISKAELKLQLWGTTAVEDNAVDQQITTIRKALGLKADGKSFILAKYKRGLQFSAEVSEAAEELPQTSDPPAVLAAETAAPVTPRRRFVILAVIAMAFIAVLLGGQAFAHHDARVLKFTQLTNDGRFKSGPLFVNDERIFFSESAVSGPDLFSIPLTGGDPTALPGLRPGLCIKDISLDGKSLLLKECGPTPSLLYVYSLDNATLHELKTQPVNAIFGPQSDEVTSNDRTSLHVINGRTGAETRLFDQSLYIRTLHWSPDGTHLRFWPYDKAGEPQGILQFDSHSKLISQLPMFPKWTTNGVWSRDGTFFFFNSGDYWRQNISVVKERGLHLGTPKVVQLTEGPGSWSWPSVGKDASRVFAICKQDRPELVRFDTATRTWIQEWEAFPAVELDYSRDRKSVAFVHLPDHSIWTSWPDGTHRKQLTFAGMLANQPHWSPDGSHIAFMAQKKKTGEWRVFVIPSAGGEPREISSDGDNQGVPSWSADGREIVFGERLGKQSLSEMCIRLINASSGRVRTMAGSSGLWSPRWSPDGKYILAVTTDNQAIRLWNPHTSTWRELIRLLDIDNASWSFDSEYIHFDGRLVPEEPLDLFRVCVKTGKLEKLVDMKGFATAADIWYGVSPDGTLLASRAYASTEIYDLKCELPE